MIALSTVYISLIVKKYGDKPFIGIPVRNRKDETEGTDQIFFDWFTYSQVHIMANNFSKSLVELGLLKIKQYHEFSMKSLGIICRNSLEWVISDLSCWNLGGTLIPISYSFDEDVMAFEINKAELEVIVIEKIILEKIKNIITQKKVTIIKTLIIFDKSFQSEESFIDDLGIKIYSFQDLIKRGELLPDKIFEGSDKNTPLTVSFTCGSTGMQKGVIISHKNICAQVGALKLLKMVNLKSFTTHLSYLSLSQIYERISFYTSMVTGKAIAFGSGNFNTLQDELKTVKPGIFLTTPKILYKLYFKIKNSIANQTSVKKQTYKNALETKRNNFRKYGEYTHSYIDKTVLNQITDILGGNVKIIITGTSNMNLKIKEYLILHFCCPIIECYGLTEATGIILLTDKNDLYSHLGAPPVPSCEVKLIKVPASSLISLDKSKFIGEICVKTEAQCLGYINDLE